MFVCVKPFARFLALLLVFSAVSTAMANDLAPTPKRAPREPVAKETLASRQPAVPPSRILEGDAFVIDSERLKIGGMEVRLFGIVPPQLSASYGPQARAALDKLAQGVAVRCQIHDRANDGRLLASCVNGSGVDLALDLLKRGLAVTARGSLVQSSLGSAYMAAEQAAQAQKTGLWAGVTVKQETPKPELVKEAPKEVLKETPKESIKVEPVSAASLSPAEKEVVANKEAAVTAASFIAANPDALADTSLGPDLALVGPSFLERYQLLATGLLMLMTFLAIIGAVLYQRRADKREEVRALAAALRGELMAARAVCLARVQQVVSEGSQNLSWPRIRVLVFQSHVARIGWLGSELARQISSIYGLASDYAAYYQGNATEADRTESASKKQALQKLIGHIDTVLPRLASVESKQPWLGGVNLLGRLMKNTPSLPTAALEYATKSMTTPAANAALSLPAAEPETPTTELVEEIQPEIKVEAKEEKPEPAPVEAKIEPKPVEMKPVEVAPVETKIAEVKPVEAKPVEIKPVEAKIETKVEAKLEATPAPEKPTENKAPSIAEVTFAEKVEEPAIKPELEKKTPEMVKPVATRSSAPSPTVTRIAKKKAAATGRKAADLAKKEIVASMSSAWEHLKQIKDVVQQNLIPHPDNMSEENEDYIAMLNAEAEAFASYDFGEVDEAPAPKRRRNS